MGAAGKQGFTAWDTQILDGELVVLSNLTQYAVGRNMCRSGNKTKIIWSEFDLSLTLVLVTFLNKLRWVRYERK